MTSWELPWPGATTNTMYRRGAAGVRLSDAARAWKDEAILRVRASSALVSPDGDLVVWIVAHPPGTWRGDLDNLLKLVLDAVFAGLRTDDRRVRDLRIVHAGPAAPPYLIVAVRGMTTRDSGLDGKGPVRLNDAPGRCHAEALALLNAAIPRSEKGRGPAHGA